MDKDIVWTAVREEIEREAAKEPILASFLYGTVLRHPTLESVVSFLLSNLLGCTAMGSGTVRDLIDEALTDDASIGEAIRADLAAVKERDAACTSFSEPLLYLKGFQALESYRVAHWLWGGDRKSLALYLQSRISAVFAVDIHPAARIGRGIMLDHATGIVVGETSVIGNNVSMLHEVTLGGTGKETGDRHPKVGDGVMIGAGAKMLGNIRIGEGAKVAAGSVVLEDVPPHCTVAGVPAKIIGRPRTDQPALEMDQSLRCADGES